MKLEPFLARPVAPGEILLSRDLWPHFGRRGVFVIVSKLSPSHVEVEVLRALFDEDDDSQEPESISLELTRAKRFLAHPRLERGDRLRHRDRLAQVKSVRPNDWHIDIEYQDSSGGEFYGNFIWMDFSPTLELFDFDASWPTLS
jgi:hypothetical protein